MQRQTPRQMDFRRQIAGVLEHPGAIAFLRYVLLAGAVLTAAWLVYFARITLSIQFPIEYREGAAQVMTGFLLRGMNPFSLENQPLGMNNYGIIYSLIAWPFAALFGNTLLVHRAVSFVFIALSGALVFRAVFTANRHIGMAAACAALVAVVLASRGGLGALPASTGVFWYLAAAVVPFERSFDRRGLVLSALLCLLAFYTKPYFVLCFGVVATYVFIFVSKKRAILYAATFGVMFAAAFFVVRAALPLYFADVIASNLTNTSRGFSYMLKQLGQLVTEFYPSVILALVILLASIPGVRMWVGRVWTRLTGSELRLPDGPLSPRIGDYFGFAFIVPLIAFILVLGLHAGAYMTYAYQLVVPFFVVWLGRQFKPEGRLLWIQVPLLLINLAVFTSTRLDPGFLSQRTSKSWSRLYTIVEHSKNVLNSPVLVPEMIGLGMQPVDSGQTEYYFTISQKYYPPGDLIGPPYDVIKERGERYMAAVDASIANRDYDVIIVTRGINIFNQSLMSQYYEQASTIYINMPQSDHEWAIEVWTPLPK